MSDDAVQPRDPGSSHKTLTVDDLVYDPGRDEMAEVTAILTSSPSGQTVELTPVDGGPSWAAPSYALELQRRAA